MRLLWVTFGYTARPLAAASEPTWPAWRAAGAKPGVLVDEEDRLGLVETSIGILAYLMHPWVVSVDRLVATGWRAEHSNRDALALLAAEQGDRIVVGPVVTDRAAVRRAATAGLGAAGGLLALGMMARRRHRREDD